MVTLSDGIVTLRPWSRDDAWFMAEAGADPAIRRYNGDLDRLGHPTWPLSTAEAEAVIDEFTSNWQAFAETGIPSRVAFAIVDATTGALAGCCGVDDWSKADVAQFGWWIAPDARRRGFATRAAILFIRWLFERGAARVFVTIVADNHPSLGVARRAGLTHEGTMRSHGIWQGERCDVMWFAALPQEWKPRELAHRDEGWQFVVVDPDSDGEPHSRTKAEWLALGAEVTAHNRDGSPVAVSTVPLRDLPEDVRIVLRRRTFHHPNADPLAADVEEFCTPDDT